MADGAFKVGRAVANMGYRVIDRVVDGVFFYLNLEPSASVGSEFAFLRGVTVDSAFGREYYINSSHFLNGPRHAMHLSEIEQFEPAMNVIDNVW